MCKCGPGYRVVTPCNQTKNESATCMLCDRNFFKTDWSNNKYCRRSLKTRVINKDEFELIRQNPFEENILQCKQGTYKADPGADYCYDIKPCPEGEILQNKGTFDMFKHIFYI